MQTDRPSRRMLWPDGPLPLMMSRCATAGRVRFVMRLVRQSLLACPVLAIALSALGCAQHSSHGPDSVRLGVPLQQYGTMRSVMREGSTEARAALRDWSGPNTVAVGAIEGLDGEITIVDGETWVSRVRDGRVVTSGPDVGPRDQATLLVASPVQHWRTIRLDAPATGADLEAAIERAAALHGMNTSQPFPFILSGTAASLDMHIINGFCPHSGGEAAAEREPRRITLAEATPVTIVGFYARDSQGVLTHHGTSVHAHAILEGQEGRMTGHIDSVGVQAGATLRLPDVTPP